VFLLHVELPVRLTAEKDIFISYDLGRTSKKKEDPVPSLRDYKGLKGIILCILSASLLRKRLINIATVFVKCNVFCLRPKLGIHTYSYGIPHINLPSQPYATSTSFIACDGMETRSYIAIASSNLP
jgi:hypothetical protein